MRKPKECKSLNGGEKGKGSLKPPAVPDTTALDEPARDLSHVSLTRCSTESAVPFSRMDAASSKLDAAATSAKPHNTQAPLLCSRRLPAGDSLKQKVKSFPHMYANALNPQNETVKQLDKIDTSEALPIIQAHEAGLRLAAKQWQPVPNSKCKLPK